MSYLRISLVLKAALCCSSLVLQQPCAVAALCYKIQRPYVSRYSLMLWQPCAAES